MSADVECPQCRTSDAIAGVEVRGTYDGVLFWLCRGCEHAWPREHGIASRDDTARRAADQWNAQQKAREA